MSEKIKKYYMIGNAHLDPVWLWNWQEGSAEAKATIRSALDRMSEYPEFKFVCSSASVYEWIEEFDPEMFEEIKQRVAEGRFIIVGGMYVQPDCNLPSGEGFARQLLYAQQYFKEKFGVTAKVGYNVDSFGHNEMLPQMLKKSGMDYYIFERPEEHEKHLPANLFRWRSPDGSFVTAYRVTEPYCFNIEDSEMLKERLDRVASECDNGAEEAIFLYGVGNHGGGPTIQNIELIKEYQKSGEKELCFADPLDFFKNAEKRTDLPEVSEELQHHASGCYAAVSEIKNAVRRSENELYAAEIYTLLANRLLNKDIPQAELKKAWKDVTFLHFHDILSGTAIHSAYKDCEMMAGEARMTAARETNNALQSVSWKIDTSDSGKGVPVIFFNPFPWDYNGLVQINRHTVAVTDKNGAAVPSQLVFSETYSVTGRSDTVFKAHIPAFGYATYYFPLADQRGYFTANGENTETNENLLVGENFLENELLRAEFDTHSGVIKSLYDKKNEKQLLSGSGAKPIVIDEYESDTWSHGIFKFDKHIGTFTDAAVTVTERGPLRVALKIESRYNNSLLMQEFSLTAGEDKLRVNVKLNWQEKHKMLKLRFNSAAENPVSYCEIPFGVTKRPCIGNEEFGHGWAEIKGDNGGIALINNSKYSYSFDKGALNLTVARSPLYADHGQKPRSDKTAFTDIGIQEFAYEVTGADKSFYELAKAARELNFTPVNIVENNHKGTLPEEYTGIFCNGDGVMISAVKRAEDNCGTVLRAYETNGKHTSAEFSGALIGKSFETHFAPFEIKTFYFPDNGGDAREVLITEFEIGE